MDIDKKLNDILTKYDIPKGKLYKRTRIYEVIREEFLGIASLNGICAFRGGGAFALEFLDCFGNIFMPKLIIDNDPEAARERLKDFGIPVASERDVDYKDFDLIIIANFDYRKEIKRELEESGIDESKIYDIHEVLKERGLGIDCPFWRFFDRPYNDIIEDNAALKKLENLYAPAMQRGEYHSRYMDNLEKVTGDSDINIRKEVSTKNRGYNGDTGNNISENTDRIREKLIFGLIGKYLDIRDFVSAFLLIDEYIDREYRNWEILKSLKTELENLLREIKTTLKNKNTRDILWLWQDALLFNRIKDMPNLSRIAETGVFFRNVYTPSPVTRSVYARCLEGQEEYRRYGDTSKCENERKYPLEIYLRQNGIEPVRITKCGQENAPLEKFNYNTALLANIFYTSMTDMYWAALNALINSKGPVFLLVHTGMETHDPFVSPWLSRENSELDDEYIKWSAGKIDNLVDSFTARFDANYRYTDYQINYFYGLLPEKSVKLLMSDHGFSMKRDVFGFSMDYIHANIIISGEGITGKTEDRLFTFENFINLVKSLINPGGAADKDIFSDYIYLYRVDIYNSQYIDIMIKNHTEYAGIAYSGIMSEYDRYIKLGNGWEIYNTEDNWEENLIDNARCKNRVSFLREKMEERGYNFLNIDNIEKFKNSKRLYKSLKLKQRKI